MTALPPLVGRKLLPHDEQAERLVIGGVLLKPSVFAEVADQVSPREFYHPTLGAVFAAMLDLDGAGKPIDQISVMAQMRTNETAGRLKALGGEVLFGELMSEVVTVEGLAYHAGVVRAKAHRRAAIEAAQEITARGYDETVSDEEAIDGAEAALVQLAQTARPVTYLPARVILSEYARTLERRTERRETVTGVATGLRALDALTLGLQDAELTILAARPSMGKTSLVMNAAANAAIEQRVAALVFSVEMSREALIERLIASEARIDSARLRVGDLGEREWRAFTRAASRIAEAPIWIDDAGAPTLLDIRAKARRWAAETATAPRRMVVVDYLQLVKGQPHKGEYNREREISEISRGLKALAKELRCPVVALSQLNRACESRADKRPQLSDLRESGAIEQDADVIAFIYRDEVYNKNTEDKGVAEIIIGKSRNGPTGTARVAFLNQYTRFENLADPDLELPLYGSGGAR